MIKKNTYQLPTAAKIFAKIGKNLKKIPYLDLSQAYQQFGVDEVTAEMLMVKIHRSFSQVIRLPFGVSPSPNISKIYGHIFNKYS